jgi:hypothetical protein
MHDIYNCVDHLMAATPPAFAACRLSSATPDNFLVPNIPYILTLAGTVLNATMPNEALLGSTKQIDLPHDRISVVDAATSSSSFTLDDLTPLAKRQRSLSPSSNSGQSIDSSYSQRLFRLTFRRGSSCVLLRYSHPTLRRSVA